MTAQQVALVLLRTLVGWHFLYEGFVKLWLPAWSRDGAPTGLVLGRLSEGRERTAGSVLPGTRRIERLLPFVDAAIAVALVLIGLSLLLGLFTRAGAVGALLLLSLFYVAQIPLSGVHQAGAEGTYLLVNKTLIEAAAVLVLLAYRTESMAGLDLLRSRAPACARDRGRDRMSLTPEQKERGRRNFLRVLAGTPALATLGAAAALKGPVRGGPVRLGIVGLGGEGRNAILKNVGPRLRRGTRALRHPPRPARPRRQPPGRGQAPAREALRRVEGDAGEGGSGGGHPRPAPVAPRRHDGRVPGGGQARAVREDDGLGRGGLPPHAGGREEDRSPAGDRLPALLQPGLPGGLRGHPEGGLAGRPLPRPPGLAPQRHLASAGRAALARLRPFALGLSHLRSPRELASLLALLEGACSRSSAATR